MVGSREHDLSVDNRVGDGRIGNRAVDERVTIGDRNVSHGSDLQSA